MINHFSKKRFLLIGVFFAILAFIGVIAGRIVTAQSTNNSLSDPFFQDIQILQKELKKDLRPEDRASLQEKLEIVSAQATQRAAGIQQLTTAPQPEITHPIPTVLLSGTRQTGILDHPSVPFSSADFLIENAWQEIIDGQYILIFAGVLTADPQQGVLLVLTESPHQTLQIWTPQKSGSVHFTRAEGFQLELTSPSGEVYYFDVPGRTFVSGFGDIVPTITPFVETTPIPTESAVRETAYP